MLKYYSFVLLMDHHDTLHQAWATSGPPNTLMWPTSYIRSFLNSYIDYENTLNIKKVPVLIQKQLQNQLTWTCTGTRIPCLPLMWPTKPKELPTPGPDGERQGLTIRAMVLGCWFESRLYLKTR